jgi:hypothetical protein
MVPVDDRQDLGHGGANEMIFRGHAAGGGPLTRALSWPEGGGGAVHARHLAPFPARGQAERSGRD